MAALEEPRQRLIDTYHIALSRFIGTEGFLVSSTHRDTNLCFNCPDREILLALQKCFLFETTFKENMLGKALLIPIDHVPPTPPLEGFMGYYRDEWHERLSMLEEKSSAKTEFAELIRRRLQLLASPVDDYFTYKSLRECYELVRKQHSEKMKLVETRSATPANLTPAKLIPYSEFDWDTPSEYTKNMVRPWRFIDNDDPNNYSYNTEINKWIHCGIMETYI